MRGAKGALAPLIGYGYTLKLRSSVKKVGRPNIKFSRCHSDFENAFLISPIELRNIYVLFWIQTLVGIHSLLSVIRRKKSLKCCSMFNLKLMMVLCTLFMYNVDIKKAAK